MSDQNQGRFLALSKIWPQGPGQFLTRLKELGFNCDYLSSDSKSLLENNWAYLTHPRSLDFNSTDHSSYCYLNKTAKNFSGTDWGLLLIDPSASSGFKSQSIPAIITNYADAAYDVILQQISKPEWIGETESIPSHVVHESNVIVGPGCHFGEGVVLESGVRIGANVHIGAHTRIGAYSCLYDHTRVGSNCIVKAHAVIGGAGFGFIQYPKIPRAVQRAHVGRVLIGDYVRIGSMVAIDRGVIEDTIVGDSTILDNFVQVAHNCELGSHNVLCGFVGLSGSTKVGNQVTFGGMSATAGHLRIGDQVMIAGQTGVNADLVSKSIVKGYPPRPVKESLRIEVLTGRLPELFERVKNLEGKKQK